MERLSEAGVLYLKDYQILTEARNEVERFLNSIVEEVYSMVSNDIDNLRLDNFKTHIWENQSSKGHMQIHFISLEGDGLFRKNKVDLYIIYKDIRNTDRISPTSGDVFVWSPAVASKLEETLVNLSIEKFGKNIYQPTTVEFDLNNSIHTAENIVKEIFNKYNLIEELVKEIVDD